MTTAIETGPDLRRAWEDARAETDALFEIVRPEFLYQRPIPERHRVLFYIGHLEAFDWNLLSGALHLKSFDPEYDRLFAFGIDPVEGNLPGDQPSDWPSMQSLRQYCAQVRDSLDAALSRREVDGDEALTQLMHIAIEHRLMHAETLAYIFHQMPFAWKRGSRALPQSGSVERPPRMIRIPAGEATLGLDREAGRFGWDNEFEAHTVPVPAFSIDQFKVTNRQFLEFLDAGGYQDERWWTQEDWAWIESQSVSHPGFWQREGGAWHWRGMFELAPLRMDGPVYVSHAEASAYAKWAGASLPTEAEWHRAAYGTFSGAEREFPWGDEPPQEPARGVFDPSLEPRFGPSCYGVEDLIGSGWEWTSTVFAPFRGFRTVAAYPGYSQPFFDGKHYVLKGGSVRTAACMLRRTFRNWFQAHYPYIYSGFRCVKP